MEEFSFGSISNRKHVQQLDEKQQTERSLKMKTNKIMKAFFMLIATMAITLGMSGCSKESKGSDDKSKALQVAKSYCNALADKDFATAETYCTEGAAFNLRTMNESAKSLLASIASSGLDFGDVGISGNDAIVKAYLGETETKIYLEKNSAGKWLICNPEL